MLCVKMGFGLVPESSSERIVMMMMNNDKFAVPPESELQIAVCL